MQMVYVSNGNIPAKWAHTIQAMKMAEAFSRIVDDFCLLTQANWMTFLLPRFDFERWYGIHHAFRVVRLGNWQAPCRRVFGPGVERDAYDAAAERYLRRARPDLVYTRWPATAERAVRLGLPTVLESHHPVDEPVFAPMPGLSTARELLAVVTITRRLATQYEEHGLAAEKILLFPDAVDLRAFPSGLGRSNVRRQLGIAEDRFVATYCGHLYDHKGIPTLIEAARAAPEVEFQFVGGWESDVQRCRAEAADCGNVRFLGFVPNLDLPLHLAAADVLLLPNSAKNPANDRTSPMKLFEYMAAGRPIIASDLPALREILEHERNCWLIEPDSPQALVRALRRARENPQHTARLADAAREDVEAYTWDKRAERILEFVGMLPRATKQETVGGPGA